MTGDEEAGDLYEEFLGDFANGGGDGFHVEDELAIGEEGRSDESAVEVVIAVFNIEGAANEFREISRGAELVVEEAFEVLRSDFFEGELATEALEDVEVSNGEVEILGGERDLGRPLVADLVIEVAKAVDERVDLGFLAFEIRDGSRLGLGFGEGFVGVGLFFDAVAGGSDQDEDHDGHHDENEAAGKGRARGVLLFGSSGSVGHGLILNRESGRLNSEL